MIVSASRRTDIPAFYSDWLLNRLRQGEVLVRNPFHPNRVSRILLDPRAVDCLVFWTKNPAPMLPRLPEIEGLGYRYYFQYTLTAYDRGLEQHVPSQEESVATFRRLADRIGPERVLWRFDPILFTRSQGPEELLRDFASLAEQLHPFTRRCTISFLSLYAKCRRNLRRVELVSLNDSEKIRFVRRLAAIAGEYGLPLQACCDSFLLDQCGIEAAHCIDGRLLAQIVGQPVQVKKDGHQRPGCGCAASIDIGAYNTCPHGCRYCYANVSELAVAGNRMAHDPCSPLLASGFTGRETISNRTAASLCSPLGRLF